MTQIIVEMESVSESRSRLKSRWESGFGVQGPDLGQIRIRVKVKVKVKVELFKMVRGISTVPLQSFFNLADGSYTRGHRWKLVKEHSTCVARLYFC